MRCSIRGPGLVAVLSTVLLVAGARAQPAPACEQPSCEHPQPGPPPEATPFLPPAPESEATSRFLKGDLDELGYVQNLTRLWVWRPEVEQGFSELRAKLTKGSSLSPRELAVLVSATAATLGDSYCSLAWGKKLARLSSPATAASVLRASGVQGLTERERALSAWARKVVRNPSGTAAEDVQALRAAGLTDREVFEATTFIAFRVAFATVNDALGARPDWQLAASVPPEVRAAVSFGRRPVDPARQAP